MHRQDLDALKYDPDPQPPRFFIDQDAPLKSLAQLAHNFAWEKSRAVFLQGMERNNEETGGTDMDDLGFFEEGEDRTKSSTASENFHLTHRLLEKPQRSARHCFHSTTSPDDQNSSNVIDKTRAIARCEGDDDVQTKSAATSSQHKHNTNCRQDPKVNTTVSKHLPKSVRCPNGRLDQRRTLEDLQAFSIQNRQVRGSSERQQ